MKVLLPLLLSFCVGCAGAPGGDAAGSTGQVGDGSTSSGGSGSGSGGGTSSSGSESDSGVGSSESGEQDPVRMLIDDAVASGFEGAILVRFEGAVVVLEGHGLAERDAERPNAPSTPFDFGSIMKDFTAAAVFSLQADGLLTTGDAIGMLLPDVPADKADITVLQLLQHQAGLGEYHDTQGDFEAMDRVQAREAILGQALLFEPGSDEAYSNAGFTLLADIVETTSGQSFTDYVHAAVIEPAGLQATGFFGEPRWRRHPTAVGYDASMFQDNDPASWPYTWALVGNGGLVTTVEELDAWLDALWSGDVLGEAGFESYRADYLRPVDFDGQEVFAYAGGGDYGFAGVAIDVPSVGGRVVIGTNTANNFDVESLAQAVALAALGG